MLAAGGFYGAAIGAGLGSNLLMMTLGLSIMLLIATTRLSKAPLKGVDVATFKLDKIFLLATTVISAALFIDGYNFIDGFIFAAMFGAYIVMALMEMRAEKKVVKKIKQEKHVGNHPDHKVVNIEESLQEKGPSKEMIKAVLAFSAGTAGIFLGAEPFIHSLQGFSVEVGISVIVLAVIISPIAGEMPEKISMMLLARKGAAGASIAVANVLGSKILNNTLLPGCGSIRSNVSRRLLCQHRSEPNSAIPDDLGDHGHYPRTHTDVYEKRNRPQGGDDARRSIYHKHLHPVPSAAGPGFALK